MWCNHILEQNRHPELWETAHRVENATWKRIAMARFPYLRTMDQIDFSAITSLKIYRELRVPYPSTTSILAI